VWAAIESDEGLPAMAAQESDSCEMFDSGASRHMFPFRTSFVTYQSIEARPITAANKNVFHAIGIRDLMIKVPNGAKSSRILLAFCAMHSTCQISHLRSYQLATS
jgi:hypothetical protein